MLNGKTRYRQHLCRVLPGALTWITTTVVFWGLWLIATFPVAAITPDDITAEAAILVAADTGQVLFSKAADKQLEPASIVKIMTLLLAMEAVERGDVSLDDEVTVSLRAESIGGSQVWLRRGEVFSLEKLLQAVAIQSANDAAVAVAEHIAGSDAAFVQRMNQRARELGMNNTRFINVNGLPPEAGEPPNLTTAADIVKMSRALLKHPAVLEWTSTWTSVFREKEPRTVLYNTNRLIQEYPGADGLKTGHTEAAGFCLVGTAKRGDLRLLSVVMNTDSDETRRRETATLLDYGFTAFTPQKVAGKGEEVGWVRVKNGVPETVAVVAGRDLTVLIKRGAGGIERELHPRADLQAPLVAGDPVGTLVVKQEGRWAGEIPVVAVQDVQRAGLFTRIWRWFRDLFRSVFKVRRK